jgi:hypothetical protein
MKASILVFAIIYNLILIGLFSYATSHPGGEVGGQMMVGFSLFFLLGLIALIVLLLFNKGFAKSKINWVLIFLSSPIPTLLIVNLFIVPRTRKAYEKSMQPDSTVTYYKKQGFNYSAVVLQECCGGGKTYKYYRVKDSVINNKKVIYWLPDSIWTYENIGSEVYRIDTFRNGKLIEK